MNAICPRCGTVTLIGAQAKRVTCNTCGLSYCRECQYWKIERKQNYCPSCSAMFTIPPSLMPPQLNALALYTPYFMAILSIPFVRLPLWYVALAIVLLPLAYTLVYIVVFSRRTGLVRAAWREVAVLVRRTLTLAAIIYIVVMGGSMTSLVAGVIFVVVLAVFALLIRRNDTHIIQELQANHHIWKAILAMSNWDALLMRFPEVRTTGDL